MGEPSLRQLKSKITMRELRGWQRYYRIEPWGERRADLRAGIVAAAMRNSMRGRGSRAFRAQDFLPEFGPRRRRMDDETVADRLVLWARGFKAQLERKKRTQGT